MPTTIQERAATVQRLVSVKGNKQASTEIFLAMNDDILTWGEAEASQSASLEQLTQAYSKSKPDRMETLQQTMPAQLKQIEKAMSYINESALYEAIKAGEFSKNDLTKTMSRLDKEGIEGFTNFFKLAGTAIDGVIIFFKNMRTDITKGIASIFTSIIKALEKAGLPYIQKMIQKLGKKIKNILEKAHNLIILFIKW